MSYATKSFPATDLTAASQSAREWVLPVTASRNLAALELTFTTSQSRTTRIVKRVDATDYPLDGGAAGAETDLLRMSPQKESLAGNTPFINGDSLVIQFSQTAGACSVSGRIIMLEA